MLDTIGTVLNSNFSTALLGALAGAFAGAVAAQRIAERSRRKEELLKEIRSTNASIMVAASICNLVLAVKSQHVKPLWDEFTNTDKARIEFYQQRTTVQKKDRAIFHYTADLRVFPYPTLPTDTLQDLVFNRLSAFGRVLSLVSILSQSVVEMKESYKRRESIIDTFRNGQISEVDIPHYYFGMKLESGHTNREYPDVVFAIHSYTDDCIFFSNLLTEDLVEHGNKLYKMYLVQFGKDAPKISQADFSKVLASGMVPPSTQYSDWLKGFAEYPK